MASWIKLCTYLVHRYLTKRRDLGTCKKSYHVATRHSCQFLKPLEWKYLGSRVSGSPKSGTTEVIASKGQPSAICQRANPRIRKAQPFFRTFPLSARRLEGPTQSPLSSPDFLLITTKNVTLPAWPLTGGKPFFPSKTSFQLH